MKAQLYSRLDPELIMPEEQRIFPIRMTRAQFSGSLMRWAVSTSLWVVLRSMATLHSMSLSQN